MLKLFLVGLGLIQPVNIIRHMSILRNLMSSTCPLPPFSLSGLSHHLMPSRLHKPIFWPLRKTWYILHDTKMKFNIKSTIQIGLLICLLGWIKVSETLSLYGQYMGLTSVFGQFYFRKVSLSLVSKKSGLPSYLSTFDLTVQVLSYS